jgi:CRP-like cAMP-binding protein
MEFNMSADTTRLIQFFIATGYISAETATEMAQAFTAIQLAKDEWMLREGQVSDTYLFLEQGWMRGYACTPDGDEVTTGIFRPGQVVFEASSFFQRQPSMENIRTLTPCVAWGISFAQLNHLFHAHAEFREFGRSRLVMGFASLKARMLAMVTQTAEQRYASLLQNHPEIFQHVPLKHIASYLGITDTSLSRIRREMLHP